MTQDNLTAVQYGINDIRMEQRPIPTPNDDQVLLQMEVVGICGSDVHYLTEGRCGPFVMDGPMVCGHEASGTVVQCGKNVKNLKPGDRVAIEPGVPCRKCALCRIGKYNLCPEMKFCATPPIDGNLSRFYCSDADYCFKLPCNVSLEEGALMEPLSVGVHGAKLGRVQMGHVCFVEGSGPIGLSMMVSVKAWGASKVLITDLYEDRLEVAKKMGADYTLKIEDSMTEEQTCKKVLEILGGEAHSSFDCAGGEKCTRIALQVTRAGGAVVILGMRELEMKLPLADALIKEIDIRGSFRYNNDYADAIEMVRSGRVNVKPMITHHFKMEDTMKAFETARDRIGNPIKIHIHANPNWKA